MSLGNDGSYFRGCSNLNVTAENRALEVLPAGSYEYNASCEGGFYYNDTSKVLYLTVEKEIIKENASSAEASNSTGPVNSSTAGPSDAQPTQWLLPVILLIGIGAAVIPWKK